jgi:PTH1 family peptidyl-tRNA hydrolase
VWAVVGLGNPGKEYAETRHNAGSRLVKSVAREWGLELRGKRYRARTAETAETAETGRGGDRVLLVLPQTFMNLSGLSVRELVRDRRIEPRNIVIVYDDLDVPLGAIRVRAQGTAGTHNGMRSVVQETGATAFPRIRIGIGPLPAGADAADYVLSPFSRAEKEILAGALDQAREALFMILGGDIKGAMNSFNAR